MNRRPLSVDLGLLEPLDSLSEPMANTARKITAESLHARLPVENPHDARSTASTAQKPFRRRAWRHGESATRRGSGTSPTKPTSAANAGRPGVKTSKSSGG